MCGPRYAPIGQPSRCQPYRSPPSSIEGAGTLSNRFQRSCAALLGAFLTLVQTQAAQAPQSPQPTCIRNVSLGLGGEDAPHASLLLRDGRIVEVLAADAALPAGMHEVDGEGLICLPAFIDAYTLTGVESPSPKIDQDVPVDVGRDVRVDMREANRKGIQPAFRVAPALGIESGDSEAWREAGFGVAHIIPARNLLGGMSCVAVTREAAARDLVLRADAFSTGAFAASGPGYPQTLMGYIAQLRQFFMDADRQQQLEERFAAKRPGPRPAFDAELDAGVRILMGESVLLSEAVSNRDVERWFKLADRFGFRMALAGGRDAWRVAEQIAERKLPVFLTTDWGKEVKDPLAKKKKDEKKKAEKEAAEADSDPEKELTEPNKDAAEAKEEAAADEEASTDEADEADEADGPSYTYDEPLAARIDRRKEWEKRRDCALRLHEAGVSFALGSGCH